MLSWLIVIMVIILIIVLITGIILMNSAFVEQGMYPTKLEIIFPLGCYIYNNYRYNIGAFWTVILEILCHIIYLWIILLYYLMWLLFGLISIIPATADSIYFIINTIKNKGE